MNVDGSPCPLTGPGHFRRFDSPACVDRQTAGVDCPLKRLFLTEMALTHSVATSDAAIVREGVLDAHRWFLPKPFTGEVLAGKIREVLDATLTETT